MKSKLLIGILMIGVVFASGCIFKQSYEDCIKDCENSDDPLFQLWYADINCSEYCECVAEQSYEDACIDFRVGKPNISNKINITTEQAVKIAKSTYEVQEFLNSGESNNISGVLGPVPYNCVNKECDYKWVIDYSYNISGRVIHPWSKKTGPVVIIEIDASTGEIIGKYSKLRDSENFK